MRGEREQYVRVLDYLPHGHPDDPHPVYRKKPIIHVVGEDNFTHARTHTTRELCSTVV